MRNNRELVFFVLGATILTLILRLAPHAPNFVPIGALALFIGAYFPKRWGLLIPIAVLSLSDLFIGFYDYRLMIVVYSAFFLMAGVGRLMHGKASALRIGLGAIGGSGIFFLTTNFAVWMLSSWYPPTIEGLVAAYTMGLPFLRMTLLGNLFYTTAFFGAYELVKMATTYRLGYTCSRSSEIKYLNAALLEKGSIK